MEAAGESWVSRLNSGERIAQIATKLSLTRISIAKWLGGQYIKVKAMMASAKCRPHNG